MHAIVIVELKGFSEVAGPLLKSMKKLELKDTHIKLKYRNVMNGIIEKSCQRIGPINHKEIGGDTWVIEFADLEAAVKSAAHILRLSYDQVVKTGLYYLKPVVAVGQANPIYEGDRFLDYETIAVYRIADSGEPFFLYILDPPTMEGLSVPALNAKLRRLPYKKQIREIDWRLYRFSSGEMSLGETFYLSSLLHENDIAFFQTSDESLMKFSELQLISKKIFAFGGPVRFRIPGYDQYVRSMFELFETKDVKCYVLTYVDKNNSPLNTYYWLTLCRLFMIEYAGKFTFAFFEVDTSKVKPLAYHVYNEEFIHLVLRSYNPNEDENTLSSSALVRNRMLASKFMDEFLENFRRVPNATPERIDAFIGHLDIQEPQKKEVQDHIQLLRRAK